MYLKNSLFFKLVKRLNLREIFILFLKFCKQTFEFMFSKKRYLDLTFTAMKTYLFGTALNCNRISMVSNSCVLGGISNI